jgi:signal transduction histidine kinase
MKTMEDPTVFPAKTYEELARENERLRKMQIRERTRTQKLLKKKTHELVATNRELQSQYTILQRRTNEAELLHSITILVQEARGFREIMQKFTDQVCQRCEWPLGHVYLNRGQKLKSLKIWYSEEEGAYSRFRKITEATRPERKNDMPVQVVTGGEYLWVQNIFDGGDSPRDQVGSRTNIIAGIGFPIKIYGETVAVAEFFITDQSHQDIETMEHVNTAATQLGAALERQQAERKVRANYRKLKQALAGLKQAQAQLVQSEKTAGLGRLAAGLAHEINNPMGYVMSNINSLTGYVGTLKGLLTEYQNFTEAVQEGDVPAQEERMGNIKGIREDEDMEFILDDISGLVSESTHGVLRVKEIIEGLKTFARMDEAQMKKVDVNEGIRATLELLNTEMHRVNLETDLGELPGLACFAGELNQVFMSLLINATQAISDEGKVAVESRATDTHIVVRISDTGEGIPDENIPKLFDPFFTTKPVGEGAGLGLASALGIVQKHRGTIEVESEVGKGSTFVIKLPLGGVEG